MLKWLGIPGQQFLNHHLLGLFQGGSLLGFRTQFIVAGPGLIPWDSDRQFLAGNGRLPGPRLRRGQSHNPQLGRGQPGQFPRARPLLPQPLPSPEMLHACLLYRRASARHSCACELHMKHPDWPCHPLSNQ